MNITAAETLIKNNYEDAKSVLLELADTTIEDRPLFSVGPPFLSVKTWCRMSSSEILMGIRDECEVAISEEAWKELMLFLDGGIYATGFDEFYSSDRDRVAVESGVRWIMDQMVAWDMDTKRTVEDNEVPIPLWWAEKNGLHDSLRYPIFVEWGNWDIIKGLRKRGLPNSFDSLDQAADFLKAYRDAEYEELTGFLPYYRVAKKKSDVSEEQWTLGNEIGD